jgi:DNA invertase Pin-like site-specific DNA recombinase
MNDKKIRCAVYTRKSSEEGLEQSFNSLEAQREACVAYVQSQKHEGWAVATEHYDDGGFSGGNMERPALRRLLDDISAGKVETVVVYKVDRLTRSLSDFAKIIEVFDSHQVSFVSVTQQFNTTTSMGRLTLNVLLSFAQFERELTGERIRDKVAASKKKGMWMGGVVPQGYDCVKHRLIVNAHEAKIVREIFRQYLQLGCVTKLRNYLAEQQIHSKVRTSVDGHTSGGAVYSRGALHHLLNNRIYTGKIVHRGQCYHGLHEPIIPQELWDKVTARLQANNQAHRTKKPKSTSSLLTGVLRDTNGIRFTPTGAVKNGKRYRYYTSQAVIQNSGSRPPVTHFPAGELESLVTAAVHRLLAAPDRYLRGTEAIPEADVVVERARDLASQWSKLDASKQHKFIRSVLKAVVVGQKNVWIEVDRMKLITVLLGHSPTGFAQTDKSENTIKLTVRFRPHRRGVELRIHYPDGGSTNRPPAPALAKAIARARGWYEKLISGEVATVQQLAQQTGLTYTYINRILPCALLSPEITDAILSGKQGHHVTLANLSKNVPLDWREQAQIFPSAR